MNNSPVFKKNGIIAIIVAIVIIAGLSWFYIYTEQDRTTTDITVSLDGIATAQLVDVSSNSVVRPVNSGETVSLPIGVDNYIIRYTGAEGYADGETPKIDTYTSELQISASYSENRLASLYLQEQQDINQAIDSYAANLDTIFDVEEGELLARGDWFGTMLIYKGDALTDRDNVIMVLHKKDGEWSVVTDPPLPSVSLREEADLQIPFEVRTALNQKVLE